MAVVHDYLVDMGGAERVVEALARIFPEARLFASVYDADVAAPTFGDGRVRSTFMQRLARRKTATKAAFPLLPLAFRTLDLEEFDVVLTSSSGFAHHARTRSDAFHVCYCHNPPRFLWQPEEYFRRQPALRRALAPTLAIFRRLDVQAARKVDAYIANSATVAERIRRAYGRRAEVIHPPVDVSRHRVTTQRSDRFLIVSRLLPYKRIELAVEAATRSALPLDVIGEGPERKRLQALAGPTVRFLGRRPDSFVRDAMAACTALIVPGTEDFGLTPIEAQASGRPVIAYANGGVLETVEDGVTGFLFFEQLWEALAQAMARARAHELPPARLRASAERFDFPVFERRIRSFLAEQAAMRPPAGSR